MKGATLVRSGDRLILSGAIDYGNADALCAEGIALLGQTGPQTVVDLAGLTSASSLSVAVLLRWARTAAACGHHLQLTRVPARCRAIVRISGLAEALPEV